MAGVLGLAAHSHLRGIPLFTWAPLSGTFADTFHRLLFRFPGSGQKDAFLGLPKSDLRVASQCCVALLAAGTALWFAMVRALPLSPRSLGMRVLGPHTHLHLPAEPPSHGSLSPSPAPGRAEPR